MRNVRTLDRWIAGIPAPDWTRRPRAKDHLRDCAVRMRRDGCSYRQISSALGVSKSSLSLWLRDVALTDEQRCLLAERSPEASRRRAASLRARRIATTERVVRQSRSQIGRLTARELLVAGVVAYWAEGSKSKPWSRSERVLFTNSDPTMITLFLRWLDMLAIPRSELRFHLQIHERADVAAALRFWQTVMAMPETQFLAPVLKRHNPKTVRKNTGERYVGCLRICVGKSTELYRRIQGWYEGIVSSLGPGVNVASTLGFDPRGSGSTPEGPATLQATLFDPAPAYVCQRAG